VITSRTCEMAKCENCFIAAHDAKTGKEVWKFYVTAAPGEPGGDTWADMPVDQRAAGPWGLPGSYDPKRKLIYWGVANPNPYTRLTRHGRHDAVSFSAPANLYSNSTLALDISTGSEKISNGKRKGKGNTKNGNKYLSWGGQFCHSL
jgi:glucose dehydrogenase